MAENDENAYFPPVLAALSVHLHTRNTSGARARAKRAQRAKRWKRTSHQTCYFWFSVARSFLSCFIFLFLFFFLVFSTFLSDALPVLLLRQVYKSGGFAAEGLQIDTLKASFSLRWFKMLQHSPNIAPKLAILCFKLVILVPFWRQAGHLCALLAPNWLILAPRWVQDAPRKA